MTGKATHGRVAKETIAKDTLVWMYETMSVIRNLEEQARELEATRRIRGLIHTYAGEEAVATGVCAALTKQDYISSTHRGHGHCIAKGADLNKVIAELFGRATGLVHGKGGDMHMGDLSVGLIGTTGMVGGGVPLAVGTALTSRVLKQGRVAVAFFGDGATAQGVVHESINLASVWKLPVVFVRENNKYGGSTPEEYAIAIRDPEAWSKCYGLAASTVDGMDVFAVYQAARAAVELARRGEGPSFIEARTYRFHGSTTWDTDTSAYRTREEEEEYHKRDPLLVFKDRALAEKLLTANELEEIQQRAAWRVAEALRLAESSPFPEVQETYADVYTNVAVSADKW